MSKGNYFLRNQRGLSDHPIRNDSISADRQYGHSALPVLSSSTVRVGYTTALNMFQLWFDGTRIELIYCTYTARISHPHKDCISHPTR